MSEVFFFTDFSKSASIALSRAVEYCEETKSHLVVVHDSSMRSTTSIPMLNGLEQLRENKLKRELQKLETILDGYFISNEIIILRNGRWKTDLLKRMKSENNVFILGQTGLGNSPIDSGSFFRKVMRVVPEDAIINPQPTISASA